MDSSKELSQNNKRGAKVFPLLVSSSDSNKDCDSDRIFSSAMSIKSLSGVSDKENTMETANDSSVGDSSDSESGDNKVAKSVVNNNDNNSENDTATSSNKQSIENNDKSLSSFKIAAKVVANLNNATLRGQRSEPVEDLSNDRDNNSSEIIFFDKRKSEKGSNSRIYRSKAKSLGQVDYMSKLRRRQIQGNTSGNFRMAISEEGKLDQIQAEDLQRRLKALAAAFTERTIRTKKKIQQPPTPSSDESEIDESKAGPSLLERLRQLSSQDPSEHGDARPLSEKVMGKFSKQVDNLKRVFSCNYILDPQSSVYVYWLALVGIVFLYNAWVIPLRAVFPYQTESNVKTWIAFDCLADTVYLIDLLVFKPHVKFIQSGFWVKEPKQTVWSYLKSFQFKMDALALFPADIVVTFFGKNHPILRLSRLLKVQTFWELFRQLDTYLAHPHRARIFHTCLYMLFMIHMVACSYYAVSTWEGIGTTTWTFDGHGNAYVRCFYFATKTATSIGKNPKPENELEYIFMTFAWLSGVFVFAILIGQIRDIIATATKAQTEYRILTAAATAYLHTLGVPGRLQDRVKLWLSYTWEQQKTLDERRILNLLPKNMKAEIALNIHVETLAKVKLFQNCETAFLRDLVVKLRSIIILPGDFVCRKGEIGREMFIVKSGNIQVIGGPTGTQVLVTLGEGSVFGEIALLGVGGMNKRTADVRAAGFCNLFVLNKADLNDVIRDYPEAQEIMQKTSKRLLRETIKKARASPSSATTSDDGASLAEEAGVIIKNKTEQPRLISTVLKVAKYYREAANAFRRELFPPTTTKIGRYLTQGSKVSSSTDVSISSGRTESNNKIENGYLSLFTSYPPSPFIPTSLGHISPELDISIMTADSSDKMFSPPSERQQEDMSDEITLSSEDGYRSDQGDQEKDNSSLLGQSDNNEETDQRKRLVVNIQQQGQERNLPHTFKRTATSPEILAGASCGTLLDRCVSPLPPYQRDKQDTFAVSSREDLNQPDVTLSGLSSTNPEAKITSFQVKRKSSRKPRSSTTKRHSLGANREEIPIELRPPLYIIEPGVFTCENEKGKASFVKKKKPIKERGRKMGSAVIDFSVGAKSCDNLEMKSVQKTACNLSASKHKLTEKDEKSKSGPTAASNSSSSTATFFANNNNP